MSERIEKISTHEEPNHPNHRPKYIDAIPLVDIIRSVKGIKSSTSKTVLNLYNKLIQELGKEFEILVDIPLVNIEKNPFSSISLSFEIHIKAVNIA